MSMLSLTAANMDRLETHEQKTMANLIVHKRYVNLVFKFPL
jgi:hypothetical protein